MISKKIIFLSTIIILLFSGNIVNSQNNYNSPQWISNAINTIEENAKKMLPEVIKTKKTPRSIEKGLRPSRDWTSGFYPGILWYLYKNSKDDFWEKNAKTVTSFLKKEQYNTDDHDVGFRIYCSYGNGWLLTKKTEYKKIIITAAKSLATRYNKNTQTIQSWEARPSREWEFPVIIDNMMNLELMMEASKLSGDIHLYDLSVKHANKTMKYQYRKDMSCSHVVDYDPKTGAFRKRDWNNGYNDPKIATWSRGQSWGLYGFTMMYRETKNKKYLKHAEKIANFLINHPNMPKDMVPYWDYESPKIPTVKDASAGAIMASALMELSTYSNHSKTYFKAGEKILKSLASKNYMAKPGTNDNYTLMHATGNYIRKSEVDGPLIYADYYFLEGLLRYTNLLNKKTLF